MIANELLKCAINNPKDITNPKDININNILSQIIDHYEDFKPYNITKEINENIMDIDMTLQVNLLRSNNIIIDKLIIFNNTYLYSDKNIIDECIKILNTVEPYKNKYKYKSKNLQIIANIKQKKTCYMKNIKKVLTIINQYYMKVIANDLSNIIWSLGKLTSMGYKYTNNNNNNNNNIVEIYNIILYNIIILITMQPIVIDASHIMKCSDEHNWIIFSDYNIDKIKWGLNKLGSI